MTDLHRDSVINVINNGIRRGIQVALDNDCFGSAVILIYAGIDAMTFLNMPGNQEDVERRDFIEWVDKYIKFPCKEQLTGKDLYGSRCGMLHNYSAFSRMSRNGECRNIGYMDNSVPEIRFNPEVSTSLVLVSIKALAKAFFEGLDKFLIDVFSKKEKADIVEERFKKIVHLYTTY
jgi:hypothetical protein